MAKRVVLMLYNGVFYHPNFFKRGPYCIKRAKYTCQHCGKKRGDEYIADTGRTDKVVIQAAHLDHDPENPRARLMALCKQCHMRYDGRIHSIKGLRTKKRKKREEAIQAGQLELPLKFKKQRKRKSA
jgi:5-methylcytosine-specific restriction endonuclease McrA